jgi:hypothetical protein
MAVCVHEGLLQALSAESSAAVMTALLRFAVVLAGVTPYQRLPRSLLPRLLQASKRLLQCSLHQLLSFSLL